MKREIIDYFKNKKEEIIKTISELVAVPSVCGVAEEGKPFGEKPHACTGKGGKLWIQNGKL